MFDNSCMKYKQTDPIITSTPYFRFHCESKECMLVTFLLGPFALIVSLHDFVLCPYFVSNLFQFVIENCFQNHLKDREGHSNENGKENFQSKNNGIISESSTEPEGS